MTAASDCRTKFLKQMNEKKCLKLTTDVYVHNLCALCIKNLKIIIIVINLYLVAISYMCIGCTRNEHLVDVQKLFFLSFYVLFLNDNKNVTKFRQ